MHPACEGDSDYRVTAPRSQLDNFCGQGMKGRSRAVVVVDQDTCDGVVRATREARRSVGCPYTAIVPQRGRGVGEGIVQTVCHLSASVPSSGGRPRRAASIQRGTVARELSRSLAYFGSRLR